MPRPATAALLIAALTTSPALAQRVLFDGRHGETAGEADWIVDADSSLQYWDSFRCLPGRRHHSAQRFPTPPQSSLTADSPETVWDGGISAWAVDLVRDALDPARGRDWQIEQYPWDAPEMTYGDPSNPQDLANYDVLVLCEPNVLFTDAEAQAIREFVWNGGGLFLIADHETSDRNCSGGGLEKHDSPLILNRLMQTAVDTSRTPPFYDPSDPDHDYGVFGIWFYENDNDDSDDRDNKDFDWFDEPRNDNVTTDPADPIVRGPFGDGSGGLGLFGATQLAVSTHPEKGNPTARPHVWRNGQSRDANPLGVWQRVTLASARYGAGRVVAVGDSSPADDGTGEGRLHPGWDKARHGVANDVLFLNATEWLADPRPDTDPPAITAGPAAAAADCRATVTWVTDEPASSRVEWGRGATLDRVASAPGFATGHAVELTGLDPETTYSYRVSSSDPAGNGPVVSAAAELTTAPLVPLAIVAGPSLSGLDHQSVTVAWTTSKPGASRVVYAAAGGPETTAATAGDGTEHRAILAGLAPATVHRFRVETTDACGTTAASLEATFTTAPRPPSRDLSGWRLVNDNPDFELTFPPGTEIPAGGVLVIGRDNDRAAFEAEWGPLAEAVVYLDSGNRILINASARPYTLLDAEGRPVDGPTVTIRAGQSKARRSGCTAGGEPGAWEDRPRAQATPGAGVPPGCGAGVVISEMADGGDFRNEFVELYFDAGGG